MLRIECPNCGFRAVEEYAYGGEVRAALAADHFRLTGVSTTPSEAGGSNLDDVWFFDNADGPVAERWFHEAGCRRWLTLRRDAHTDTPLSNTHLSDTQTDGH